MVAKKQDRAYGVSQVLEHIEKLQHGHDGLIFTCAQTPYVLGTDEKMYVLPWAQLEKLTFQIEVETRL
jgi:mRNA guanylyltransferase